jgi:NDP-sugar pyrophosphorylase family protein
VVLCGGVGRRLGALTKDLPKPMVMIKDRPFLDILMEYIRSFGLRSFILCVGYKKDVVRDYFMAHKGDFEIAFSEEDEGRLLGTGGAIKNAEGAIKSDSFLVVNGDSFLLIDLGNFFEFHKKKQAVVSIVLTKTAKRLDAGSVRIGGNDEIVGFSEKKGVDDETYMNTGLYFFNKAVFGHIPSGSHFSLEYDLFPALIGKGIYGYTTDADVVDIGTPERLEKAKGFFSGAYKK